MGWCWPTPPQHGGLAIELVLVVVVEIWVVCCCWMQDVVVHLVVRGDLCNITIQIT